MLLDESTQRLYHRFTIGYGEQASKDWLIPLGQGITGTAAATGRAVRVADVREDPRYINIIDSVRSELVVPLVVKGQSIGVLDIQSTQVDYFTRDQQSVLTLMASRLAVAIENARLFERVRSQADTLLVLNEVGREANSILDVEELLRRAAELVKRVINYQILGILLYDEATNVFRHRLDVKYGQSALGKMRVAPNEGVVGAAISTGQPVRVPDVTNDLRYIMVNQETRSELAIPLIHKGRVVGVLDLESPQTNYFTEDHVQTLMILERIWRSRSKTPASTNGWPATRPAWSANSQPRSACKTRCCVPCPPSILASTSPHGFFPREKFAATYTISFPTARSNWASRSGTSAARAAPRRSTEPLPPVFFGASLRTNFSPRNFFAS